MTSDSLLQKLRKYKLVYVATPYSDYPGGLDRAYEDACIVAAALLDEGVRVFSPISHTHGLAKHSDLDPRSPLWLELDEPFMEVCDALVIAELSGHDESHGVNYEKDVFDSAGKDVFYVDPESLEIRQ